MTPPRTMRHKCRSFSSLILYPFFISRTCSYFFRVPFTVSRKYHLRKSMQKGDMRSTPGMSTLMKSTNPISCDSALPMMMLGGSPISVAVPPMLLNSVSERRNGSGSISSCWHMRTVTGARSRTVVTLSRKADSTAVSEQRIAISANVFPRDSPTRLKVATSNTPVDASFPTRIIIPKSSASAPSSMNSTTRTRSGVLSTSSSRPNITNDPAIAASMRWITSAAMRANTTSSTTSAIHG
mmetsp:Transcript_48982/g.93620  ORF Transcript_48982/g.93620 Transcript_48982/m.93620 type:complete len:239 (-) Transcript_48982:1908-2624(-)